MNKYYNNHKEQIRVGNIEMFLEIAIDIHLILQKNIDEDLELQEYKITFTNPLDGQEVETIDFDHMERLFYLQNERFKLEINGILDLSTFYEALINEIGIVEFGSGYFKEHLDKLSILSKWEIVLKLIFNRSFPRNSKFFQTMQEVIKSRNHLAHYKTKLASSEKNEIYNYKILAEGLHELKNFIAYLKTLDDEKSIYTFITIDKQIERLTE
jgi:hypothetical protein